MNSKAHFFTRYIQSLKWDRLQVSGDSIRKIPTRWDYHGHQYTIIQASEYAGLLQPSAGEIGCNVGNNVLEKKKKGRKMEISPSSEANRLMSCTENPLHCDSVPDDI